MIDVIVTPAECFAVGRAVLRAIDRGDFPEADERERMAEIAAALEAAARATIDDRRPPVRLTYFVYVNGFPLGREHTGGGDAIAAAENAKRDRPDALVTVAVESPDRPADMTATQPGTRCTVGMIVEGAAAPAPPVHEGGAPPPVVVPDVLIECALGQGHAGRHSGQFPDGTPVEW